METKKREKKNMKKAELRKEWKGDRSDDRVDYIVYLKE